MKNLNFLVKASEEYLKLAQKGSVKTAQTVNTDSSLVDSIRASLGKPILDLGNKVLNERAVSSITVSVSYNRPLATFSVSSTGQEAAKVDSEFKAILDGKFGPTVSKMISKQAPDNNFNFNLLTIEPA